MKHRDWKTIPSFYLGWGLTWWELCILSLKRSTFQSSKQLDHVGYMVRVA